MSKIKQSLNQNLSQQEIAFILGIPFFFFLLLEILLRQFGFPLTQLTLGVTDSDLGWIMNPPSSTLTTPSKNPDLLIIGDELVYEDARNPQHFLQKLQKDYGLKVSALAGNGYGPDQHLIHLNLLKTAVPRSKTVILFFNSFNDFIDSQNPFFSRTGFPPKPYFLLENQTLKIQNKHLSDGLLNFWALILQDHSATYSFLKLLYQKLHLVRSHHEHLLPKNLLFTSRVPSADAVAALQKRNQTGFAVTAKILREMNQWAEKTLGAKLIIFLHPHGFSHDGSFSTDPATLDFFRSLRISTFDVSCWAQKKSFLFPDFALDRSGQMRKEGHLGMAILLDELAKNKITHPECFLNYEKKENPFVVP